MKKVHQWLILFLCISSCSKHPVNIVPATVTGVYISNEGNFTFGNAEISFYDPAKQQVTNNLFKTANNYSLGDVAQSIYIRDSTAFIVVNNSQKIEMVRLPSFQKIRTINIPHSSPRYFLAVNDSIAYVTELYAGKIYVVNYQTGNLVKTIDQMAAWTEHMVMLNNNVIVEERNLDAHPSTTFKLAVINVSGNTLTDHFTYNGANVNGIVKDKFNRIWIAVSQDSAHTVHSAFYCLNSDMTGSKFITFPFGHTPVNLCINGSGDELYYFDGDINRISINDTVIPASAFIQAGGRNLYGLAADPVTGDVYTSDALDYVQPSRVYRYDKNGTLIQSFTAGVISGNFAFRYE